MHRVRSGMSLNLDSHRWVRKIVKLKRNESARANSHILGTQISIQKLILVTPDRFQIQDKHSQNNLLPEIDLRADSPTTKRSSTTQELLTTHLEITSHSRPKYQSTFPRPLNYSNKWIFEFIRKFFQDLTIRDSWSKFPVLDSTGNSIFLILVTIASYIN